MSFGTTNVLIVFIDLMNWVFTPYSDYFVVVFINDIFIYSQSQKWYEQHLRIVLQVLCNMKLYAKLQKYDFRLRSLSWRHMVSIGGISIDQSKVEAVEAGLRSTNAIEVRSFLRLTDIIGGSWKGSPGSRLPLHNWRRRGKNSCGSTSVRRVSRI